MKCIEGNFYRLTPINEFTPKYDLELLYDIGGKNPRQEFKITGYGLPLESAIQRIIIYAVNKKLKDDIVTLKQFLDEYKKEADSIRRELGGIDE